MAVARNHANLLRSYDISCFSINRQKDDEILDNNNGKSKFYLYEKRLWIG